MKLEFTAQAEEQLHDILDYIEIQFGERTALLVSRAIDAQVMQLCSWPEFGRPVEQVPELRKLVIRKRTVVFYRIVCDTIVVTGIKSTYQNYSPEDVS